METINDQHQENLIMACIGGSQAHGAKLGATDDTDWYGLYIPPPTKVLGSNVRSILFSLLEAKLAATGHKMWMCACIP
jgi:hypothetical protein